MDLSFIIVNFNTEDLLQKCLESIFKFSKDVLFEVIVIDNNSSDGSAEMVQDSFPQVKLVVNKRNLGFGIANNQGSEVAKGDYLFFFNSDAYLLENSALILKKYLDKNPNVACVGPLILNPDNTLQQSIGFFPHLPQMLYWMSFLDDLPKGYLLKPYHVDHDVFYKNEQTVGWITGAAMFVRRKIFRKIGGFDKNIFMYGEDFELCYRAKLAGFKVVFSPLTKVIHLGRGSVGKANIGAIVSEYVGLMYFYTKYKSKLAKLILLFLLKIGALLRILIFGLILARKELLKAYWKALVKFDFGNI